MTAEPKVELARHYEVHEWQVPIVSFEVEGGGAA